MPIAKRMRIMTRVFEMAIWPAESEVRVRTTLSATAQTQPPVK
jgi:hypothetical protein